MELMNSSKIDPEEVGEAFANQVLKKYFGTELFIGSSIEMKLQEMASVIYQDVPDSEYFGATVTYKTGEVFVALNTYQPLRLRYFTAAHELWHLLGYNQFFEDEKKQERAADRFAAALMMPDTVVGNLWGKFKKEFGSEKAIIMIADFTATPYEAVARRVSELNLPGSTGIKKYKEDKWISLRKDYNFPDSPLDQSFQSTSFIEYEKEVKKAVEDGEIDFLSAVNKLSKVSHEKAKEYQEKAMSAWVSVQKEEAEDC